MEKYGVVTEAPKPKTASQGLGCPEPGCDQEISRVVDTPMCPVHGTSPFEKKPEKNKDED